MSTPVTKEQAIASALDGMVEGLAPATIGVLSPLRAAELRLECAQLALRAAPICDVDGQLDEIMRFAERIARFVIDGETPCAENAAGDGSC
jgi:hypothetical protein